MAVTKSNFLTLSDQDALVNLGQTTRQEGAVCFEVFNANAVLFGLSVPDIALLSRCLRLVVRPGCLAGLAALLRQTVLLLLFVLLGLVLV